MQVGGWGGVGEAGFTTGRMGLVTKMAKNCNLQNSVIKDFSKHSHWHAKCAV